MSIQTLASQPTATMYASCSIDDLMQQVDNLIQHAFSEQADVSDDNNLCIEAVKYHFATQGQQVRARLCLDVGIKLGIHYDDMLILAAVSELLHNASLIHDDIQDGDETRRNQPTVWKQFSVNIAICAGDLLISTAYGVLAGYSQPKLLPKLISAINAQTRLAIEGQSKDIAYKNNPHIPIEQYVQIAKKKSGALLSLPIELALIAAEQNAYIELARKASTHFAVGYQIADDLEDIVKDTGNQSISQSVNIVLVLKALGYSNSQEAAVTMCRRYLNNAIDCAHQLPNGAGLLLSSLAETLKNKINRCTQ